VGAWLLVLTPTQGERLTEVHDTLLLLQQMLHAVDYEIGYLTAVVRGTMNTRCLKLGDVWLFADAHARYRRNEPCTLPSANVFQQSSDTLRRVSLKLQAAHMALIRILL
jgi:hypothetical protein